MQVNIHKTTSHMAKTVAEAGAEAIRNALKKQGKANIILATGASQFVMLEQLVLCADIDWSVVTAYHLDEYCGVDKDHPVSFRRYMMERFVEKVPSLKRFIWINGDAEDLDDEIRRLNEDLASTPIDVAFIGIGENGHLAFNDPLADFETEAPFQVVRMDEKSRLQQVVEGWFDAVQDVPDLAISMSLRQILQSERILVTVPDERKAEAVKAAIEGPICKVCTASILRTHDRAELHLDLPAASRLEYYKQ